MIVTGRSRTVGTQVLEAITWHRRQEPGGAGWRVAGDRRQADAVRAAGRVVGGSATGACVAVGHGQVDGCVLQARPSGTGGRARAAGTAGRRAGGRHGGRARTADAQIRRLGDPVAARW